MLYPSTPRSLQHKLLGFGHGDNGHISSLHRVIQVKKEARLSYSYNKYGHSVPCSKLIVCQEAAKILFLANSPRNGSREREIPESIQFHARLKNPLFILVGSAKPKY